MDEHDYANGASSEESKENGFIAAKKEWPGTKKVDFTRGTGPEHADAAGFHLMNIVVHAATCSASVWLFRAVFAGKNNNSSNDPKRTIFKTKLRNSKL